MASYPALVERPALPGASPLTSAPKRLDTLFLDTTFCHPTYDFPPQAAARKFAILDLAVVSHQSPIPITVLYT